MNIHSLARTCPASRALMLERIERRGWSVEEAAKAAGLSSRRSYVWLERWRQLGVNGLRDASSRPRKRHERRRLARPW